MVFEARLIVRQQGRNLKSWQNRIEKTKSRTEESDGGVSQGCLIVRDGNPLRGQGKKPELFLETEHT